MPELRHDLIQKRWVIIATERGLRPDDFLRQNVALPGTICPFCEGNEGRTPPEITSLRTNGSSPNQPGWEIRVVPNKFPALRIEGDLERKGVGVHDRMNGVGAHEVIIETPLHDFNLTDAPLPVLENILRMYRERLADLLRDRRLKSVMIFRNYGAAAGATIAHPHTQVIATPVIPLILAGELNSALEHYRRKERCLFCDVIHQELDSGDRVVSSDDQFVALAPFASRFPFEILLAPRRHHHNFALISDAMIRQLAAVLRDVLRRIRRCLKDPPYNLVIHSVPNQHSIPHRPHQWETVENDYHWHIEIMPRLTQVAGFEWGTGLYINPTAPEEAAKYLREAEI